MFQGLMDALIAEAASRGLVGLDLVSVDSTVVRAHQESAGLAICGETLTPSNRRCPREKGLRCRSSRRYGGWFVRSPDRTGPGR